MGFVTAWETYYTLERIAKVWCAPFEMIEHIPDIREAKGYGKNVCLDRSSGRLYVAPGYWQLFHRSAEEADRAASLIFHEIIHHVLSVAGVTGTSSLGTQYAVTAYYAGQPYGIPKCPNNKLYAWPNHAPRGSVIPKNFVGAFGKAER